MCFFFSFECIEGWDSFFRKEWNLMWLKWEEIIKIKCVDLENSKIVYSSWRKEISWDAELFLRIQGTLISAKFRSSGGAGRRDWNYLIRVALNVATCLGWVLWFNPWEPWIYEIKEEDGWRGKITSWSLVLWCTCRYARVHYGLCIDEHCSRTARFHEQL